MVEWREICSERLRLQLALQQQPSAYPLPRNLSRAKRQSISRPYGCRVHRAVTLSVLLLKIPKILSLGISLFWPRYSSHNFSASRNSPGFQLAYFRFQSRSCHVFEKIFPAFLFWAWRFVHIRGLPKITRGEEEKCGQNFCQGKNNCPLHPYIPFIVITTHFWWEKISLPPLSIGLYAQHQQQ